MGLDIYAGTLTRYYAKNWKTVTQQMAERNGYRYSTIYAKPQGKGLPLNVLQEDMRQYSSKTADALASYYNRICESWEENNEKDYFTNKPDWPAYGALLLYISCKKYKLPLPQLVKKDWDYLKDPILARTLEDKEFGFSLKHTEWWLPFNDLLYFDYQTPTNKNTTMATTGVLLSELREINELGWNADDGTILEWQKTEGYSSDAEYDVLSLAKFAFSIFYQAALFSEKDRVPILMDY